MAHSILITGGSGYLGGSLLAGFQNENIQGYENLFALVRNDEQARQVQEYGATPLFIDLKSEDDIRETVVKNKITVVFWLIGVWSFDAQAGFIKGLGEVKRKTGLDVHFLQTGGAKQFSSLAGHPNDEPLLDTNVELFETQKTAKSAFGFLKNSLDVNCKVIEEGEKNGVRTYLFVPCIVYGEGSGFGNKVSIQTRDIVTAAKASGRVYSVDEGTPEWPVCHISDNTALYIQILRCILESKEVNHGRQGYFLAASGRIAWNDLYNAMAKALVNQCVIKDARVENANAEALEIMAKALDVPSGVVRVKIAGNCTLTGENGKQIGWKPKYQPEHILEAAEKEVEIIVREMAKI